MKASLRAPMAALVAAAASLALSGCDAMRPAPQGVGHVDDGAITARITSELVADRNIDSAAIKVETTNGTVLLSGFARSPLEKQTAESIAIKIRGVSLVKNEIAVRP